MPLEGSLYSNPFYVCPALKTLLRLTGFTPPEIPDADFIREVDAKWRGGAVVYADAMDSIKTMLTGADPAAVFGPDEPIPTLNELLVDTGTLRQMEIRTVRGPAIPDGTVSVIVTGGTTNWMQRRVAELKRQLRKHVIRVEMIFAFAGERVCDTDTDLANPLVNQWRDERGRYPREYELLEYILRQEGFERIVVIPGGRVDLDIESFFAQPQWRELLQHPVYMPINANALDRVLAVRYALRMVRSDFDGADPQFFFSVDGFPLASTPEEEADPAHFQRPATMFPALSKLIYELDRLNRFG